MNKATDDLISRKQAIEEILALCPKETKPDSLDEYGATILYGIVDVILKRLPAVNTLKPRLITAEEFVNADKYGFLPVWTEEKDGDLYCECIPSMAVKDEGYKVQYRFWTSRPTDEQRETTPWMIIEE